MRRACLCEMSHVFVCVRDVACVCGETCSIGLHTYETVLLYAKGHTVREREREKNIKFFFFFLQTNYWSVRLLEMAGKR